MSIKTPICDLFGVEKPIFLAGMAGVAYAEVCAAVSEAGGFGTLGMATLPPEDIRQQMRRVRELTDKPFGVDLLAAMPETLEAAVDVIIDEGAKAFISGLGVPFPILKRLKDAGLLVMNMCGTVRHAVKAAEAGCDAVVAQGTEAGGHTGKVAGFALVPQVVDAVDIPVLAAGAIVDGRGLAAALAFGAQGVWVGTRFIASKEAHAAQLYHQRLIEARDEDTAITRSYSGKPMRVLKNQWVAEWEAKPDQIQPFPQQAMLSASQNVMGGIGGKTEGLDADRDCFPAGQGAGAITAVESAADIVNRIVAEAEETIGKLGRLAG